MVHPRLCPTASSLAVNRMTHTMDRTARRRTMLIASINRGRVVSTHCFGCSGRHDVVASKKLKAVKFKLPTTVKTAFNTPRHAIYIFVKSNKLRVGVRRLKAVVRRGTPIGVVYLGGGFLKGIHR